MHGGDIYRNKIKYDFSVNLNPLGMPEYLKETAFMDSFKIYPDYDYQRERECIASYLNLGYISMYNHSVPDDWSRDRTDATDSVRVKGEDIVLGNGASELIMAVFNSVRPKEVFIPVPSFSGYERAARALGCHVTFYEMKEERNFLPYENIRDFIPGDTDLIILTNPNNPTGKLYPDEFLNDILEYTKEKNITVLLDLCFAELSKPGVFSLKDGTLADNIIAVGALTKSLALPGARIGYALVKNEMLRERLRAFLPEWNISGPASLVINTVFGSRLDETISYLDKSRKFISEEREYLISELRKNGIKVFDSDTNFILLKSGNDLYNELLKKEILIRDCSDFRGLGKGFYRIAVRRKVENDILLNAL